MKKILLILTLFSFVSCSDLTGESTGANNLGLGGLLGNISFVEVGSNLYRLEGTATNGGNTAHSYNLDFKLGNSDEFSVLLFTREDLSGGLEVKFTRVDANTVKAKFSLNGTEDFVNFESSENVSVVIDIHNDENDAHIIMWDQTGPFGDEECMDDETCLFNTDHFGTKWGSHGKAAGSFWGVKSIKENIIKLEGPNETVFNH